MESRGVYWKSIYATMIQAGLNPKVVNARHVKNVPDRKTATLDSQWLASLAHYGLHKTLEALILHAIKLWEQGWKSTDFYHESKQLKLKGV